MTSRQSGLVTLRFYDYDEKKCPKEFNALTGDNEVWVLVNSVIAAHVRGDTLWCGRVRVGM
jgi:hypothetical protein